METVAEDSKSHASKKFDFERATQAYLRVSQLYDIICQNSSIKDYIRRETDAWEALLDAKREYEASDEYLR